jgi:hypothetical protein
MRSLAVGVVLLFPLISLGQLPSSRCDSTHAPLAECTSLTEVEPVPDVDLGGDDPLAPNPFLDHAGQSQSAQTAALTASDNDLHAGAGMIARRELPKKPSFRWRRALFESFLFLSAQQAYVVPEDYRWIVGKSGVPFNHYWRDYKQSLASQFSSGWNDGDPALFNYVGHPIQGALTSFIQIQNDPQGEKLEFSNTKAYWWSRFKATMWNTAYSMQWSMGPLSEMTVEKYGSKARPPWNHDGTWPCKEKNCFTGVGQVNLVITPVGGLGWLLAEDLLDKHVVRRVESATRNRFLINATRGALNPIRGAASILHGKPPWYRASRDGVRLYLSDDKTTTAPKEGTRDAQE